MAAPQAIHDTVRIVKVIVDTVRTSSKDSFDLMSKMDSFYSNAWNKLMFFFSVIGVGAPIAVQFYQKKQLRLSKEDVYKKIEEDLKKAESEIKLFFEGSIANAKDELKQEINKEKEYLSNYTEAGVYHIQALVRQDSMPESSLFSALEALQKHLKTDGADRASACLFLAKNAIKKLNKQTIDIYYNFRRKDFKEVLKEISNLTNVEEIIDGISDLETTYEALSSKS